MTIRDAIKERHSVRQYKNMPGRSSGKKGKMAVFKMSNYSYELLESLSLLNKGLVRMEKSGRKQRADHMP